ncbi:aspartate/glutamate racemase family protein [Devosia lacusdianchii]|jgi:arylmalonate decarboxylase|uniref:arylmalonate decarboxylase n=1 Tax=Devosia lacusdianchii TaxID=2917991 RepID=UPI001F054B92|nr:aspartate/glutamate racemase family protein [Devosia sp. JXJ CY 41]
MLKRASLGLIVPPAAGAVPPDAAQVYPQFDFIAEGLGLAEMSNEGYDSVVDSVGAAAERLASRGASIVALMGTSLSFYRGPQFNLALETEIATRSKLPSLTMSSAMLEALARLGVRRLAVATAYRSDVNSALRLFLEAAGIELASLEHLGIASIEQVHQVSEAAVTEMGRRALQAAPNAEALLISCGGLPTRAAVRILEAETGKPVISSPLAGLWATVRRAGLDPRAAGEGRLFEAAAKL